MKRLVLFLSVVFLSLAFTLSASPITKAWSGDLPICEEANGDPFPTPAQLITAYNDNTSADIDSESSFIITRNTGFTGWTVWGLDDGNTINFVTIDGANYFRDYPSNGTRKSFSPTFTYSNESSMNAAYDGGGSNHEGFNCILTVYNVGYGVSGVFGYDGTTYTEYVFPGESPDPSPILTPSPDPEPAASSEMSAGQKIGIVITFAIGLYVIWILRFRNPN